MALYSSTSTETVALKIGVVYFKQYRNGVHFSRDLGENKFKTTTSYRLSRLLAAPNIRLQTWKSRKNTIKRTGTLFVFVSSSSITKNSETIFSCTRNSKSQKLTISLKNQFTCKISWTRTYHPLQIIDKKNSYSMQK